MTLEFDEKAHRYSMNNQELPGVTTILKKAGRTWNGMMAPGAIYRGVAVHAAAHYRIHNDLNRDSVHAKIIPYVKAFDDFLFESEFKPNLDFCERPMHHPLGYCGRPDLVGLLHNYPSVLDIKSGGLGYVRYQTAAYAEFPELYEFYCMPLRRYSLQLNDKGRLYLTEFSDPNDFAVFLDDLEDFNSQVSI